MTDFADRLAHLRREAEAGGAHEGYLVAPLPQRPACMVGLSSEGRPALLVRTRDAAPEMPLRLAGIFARYAMECSLREDGAERMECLSIVECIAADAAIETHFSDCMDSLGATLGSMPSISDLATSVWRLVGMFQALVAPAAREVTGVIGELCVIYAAADAALAVRSWHAVPNERYDFVADGLRLDVKATSSSRRVHGLTADQACPPDGAIGLLVSVLVREASGGSSLGRLVAMIIDRLGSDHEAALRLREGLSLSLGASMAIAMDRCFDFEEAMGSLVLYDLRTLPALRPPFPSEVSQISFRVDLSNTETVRLHDVRHALSRSSASLLPS